MPLLSCNLNIWLDISVTKAGGNLKPEGYCCINFLMFFNSGRSKSGDREPLGLKKIVNAVAKFFTFGQKIGRIAFKYMRLIGAQPVNFIGSEAVHIVFRYYRAFSFLNPGQLYFVVAMQVRIKIRQRLFLNNDRLIDRNRDRKLQDFHIRNFINIIPIINSKYLKSFISWLIFD